MANRIPPHTDGEVDDAIALPVGLNSPDWEKPGSETNVKGVANSASSGSDIEVGRPVAEKEVEDPNLVTWDNPDDPTNPMNFKWSRKMGVVLTVSCLTLVVSMTSSMFAPAVPAIMKEFNCSSPLLSSFVVSIYILGFAIGPIFIAPLSEMYGRSIIYKISTALFTAFTIASGSTSIALGSGSVADVIPIEQRGKFTALYILGPVIGPAIGPVIGGFLAAVSWRWVFRLVAIISGLMCIVTYFLLPETYGPFVLHVKAKRLRKETGNTMLHTRFENRSSRGAAKFLSNIVRPLKLIMLSPIVTLMSLFVASGYGMMYLLFTTITNVFQEQYGFKDGIVGLAFLGYGLGSVVGIILVVLYCDRILLHMAAKSATKEKRPEFRLPLLCILSPFSIIGLLIYGWSVEYKVHWIVPEIGTFLVGVGILATISPTVSYLVDAYIIYAASASSASTFVRSLGGAFLPLAGRKLYSSLGYGYGNSLLALILLVLTPVPYIMFFKGESLRKRFQPKLN